MHVYKVVHHKRNKNLKQTARVSTYLRPDHLNDHEYRLSLLEDLLQHGHRVILITYIGVRHTL